MKTWTLLNNLFKKLVICRRLLFTKTQSKKSALFLSCLRWGKTALTRVLDITLNNMIAKLHESWSFGECKVPLHCPLWSEEVAPHRVLSMGQIELNCVFMLNWTAWNRLFWHLNWVLMLNWILWNRTVSKFNCQYV